MARKLHSFSTSVVDEVSGQPRPQAAAAPRSREFIEGRHSWSECFGEEKAVASAAVRTPDGSATSTECVQEGKLSERADIHSPHRVPN